MAEGERPAEIEVTPAMIEAGLSALFRIDIAAVDLDEMRLALAEAFRAMVLAFHR